METKIETREETLARWDRGRLLANLAIAPYLEVEFPVHIGNCIWNGKRFRRTAHAHTEGTYKGWICILSAKRMTAHDLLLHEIAHIIVGSGHGHDDHWRYVCLTLGGTLQETDAGGDIHKRVRKSPKYRGLFNQHHIGCPCHAFERNA